MNRMFVFAVLGLMAAPMRASAANIAVLIPQAWILEGDDPANDDPPGAKEFTFETIMAQHDGVYSLIVHLEEELGHNVKPYGTDTDVPSEVIEQNDLIFITEQIGSGSVAGDYRGSTTPVINTEGFLLDDFGFTLGEALFSGDLGANQIRITNPDHPITRGLPETFAPSVDSETTGEPQIIHFSSVTDPLIIVEELENTILAVLPEATNTEFENTPILFALEAGTTLDTGDETQARWVFPLYSDTVIPDVDLHTYSYLNELGWQLLDQSIAWALGGDTGVYDWPIMDS